MKAEKEKQIAKMIKRAGPADLSRWYDLVELAMGDKAIKNSLSDELGITFETAADLYETMLMVYRAMPTRQQDSEDMKVKQRAEYMPPLYPPKAKYKSPFAQLRLSVGLTQKELAEKANMPYQRIQKIEYGEIKIANITAVNAVAIARALGITTEELLEIKQ